MGRSFLKACLACLAFFVGGAIGLALIGLLSFVSCSPAAMVQHWGESAITLPPGRKLVGASWKGSNLWTVTRPAKAGETADEIWHMDEHSSWGGFSSRIILRETPR